MGDMGDLFNDYKADRKNLKDIYGLPCPICKEKLPKANPKILLPGGCCKMHKYRDTRDPAIMEKDIKFKEIKPEV